MRRLPRDLIGRATAVLALAIAGLLFAQWPLRDLVGAGSAQANDLAQWLFALYAAVAVAHAGQRGAHLVARPDLAGRGGGWRAAGGALCVLPWSLYLLATSLPQAWRSLVGAERFPETMNPGYFVIKLALLVLGLLLALQAGRELGAALRESRRRPG